MAGSLASMKRPSNRPDALGSKPGAEEDSVLAFESEAEAALRASIRRRNSPLLTFAAITALIAAAAGVYFLRTQPDAPASAPPPVTPAVIAPPKTSDVIIDSRPNGAQVFVDGVSKGVTPVSLSLPVGPHILELRNGASIRSIPLAVELGKVISQYIELPAAPALVDATTGRLEVTSEPAGAPVYIDGAARGVTPLVLATVNPGPHQVVIGRGDSAVTRNVRISAGATATVVASAAPTGAAGWVSIKSPIDLQITENGKVIGTTTAERVMLPVGRHDFDLVNEALGFRTSLSVQVAAGKTSASTVAVPNGSLSVNALPWADVFVDGRPAGTTPLGNLSVPIGSHEIVLRHPTFGERKQTVIVTTRSAVRIGIDFAK